MDAAVLRRGLRDLEDIAAQVGGFTVENRVVGGFEFGVGGGVGEEAERGRGEVIEAFFKGEPFAAFALGHPASRVRIGESVQHEVVESGMLVKQNSTGNISSFGEDAVGELYVLASDGKIYELAEVAGK